MLFKKNQITGEKNLNRTTLMNKMGIKNNKIKVN